MSPEPAALPPHDHAARRDRLRASLARDELDLLLVTGAANVRYLSGFTGSNGQLLVGAHPDDDRLVTDARYLDRAASEAPELPVLRSRDATGAALTQVDGGRLAVEADHLSFASGRALEDRAAEAGADLVATQGLVEPLRAVKDDAEVARLERACAVTVEALGWLLDTVVAVGVSELDLARALEARFVALGAEAAAFPTIVASGPHGAAPHHAPTARPLTRGDPLTVDCGARVDGYHADCTRTVAIGHLDDPLAQVHAIVEQAQAAGRAAALAGATGGQVDAAARTVIERAGHARHFVHGTGHGVGLEIHEAPSIARGSSAALTSGTALTVEPGVYLSQVGGVRIEDTVLVTDGAARVLTAAPRGLRVL